MNIKMKREGKQEDIIKQFVKRDDNSYDILKLYLTKDGQIKKSKYVARDLCMLDYEVKLLKKEGYKEV